MNVLSIQSSVAFGHVGNDAARLPLQMLGHEIWAIDTVKFSNHPGHGGFKGRVTPAAEVRDLLEGLNGLGLFRRTHAVISGYLGEPDTGAVIADVVTAIKGVNPDAFYLCDPVMGDVDGGAAGGRVFVRPGVPEQLRERLVPLADVVTPNRFELELLTGLPAGSLDGAIAAAASLRARGPRLVVVTSFDGDDTPADTIDTLALTDRTCWRVRSPRLERRFDGAGDCFAALFLGHYLNSRAPDQALSAAISSLQPILAATGDDRDLALVQARAALLDPPVRYAAEACR